MQLEFKKSCIDKFNSYVSFAVLCELINICFRLCIFDSVPLRIECNIVAVAISADYTSMLTIDSSNTVSN